MIDADIKPIKKNRKSKEQTLGAIITDSEASQHIAVIYRVTVKCPNQDYYYIGSKKFSSDPKWKYYKTSSKNKLFKKMYKDKEIIKIWEVLEFVNDSRYILTAETRHIVAHRMDHGSKCMNLADAQGIPFHKTKRSKPNPNRFRTI
jgi:hypothetical protein